MQATIHVMQRRSLTGCRQPVQRRKTMSLSPRASFPHRPHPAAVRRYSLDFSAGPDNVVSTASTGSTASRTVPCPRASDLLPHQIQQVLRLSKGMACTVGQPVADMQARLLMQASHDERATGSMDEAPGKAGSLCFADVVSLYDPDEEHRQEKMVLTRFSLQGREELHAHNMALSYTLVSDRQWRLVLGGPDLRVLGHERIRCAEIIFPGKCLVQLSLTKGMLHGFDGELAGTCTGLARQRQWGWFGHENRRCDEPTGQGWDPNLLATVESARVVVIGDRAIAWNTVRQWQQTVPVEKTEEALAWEMARMSLPL
jgi:hypothetical protein